MGLSNRRFIAAKIETTSGTEQPPAGTDVILCGNFNCTPIAGSTVQRNLIRPWFGNNQSITVESYATIDFEVEITGSGSAGTAPKYASLLKACGFNETINASTSVVYLPITTSVPTLTFHFYMDSIKHVMVGAVGNVSFDFTTKKIPTMKFSFTGGLGTTPYLASQTQPTATYSTITPIPFLTNNVTCNISLTAGTDYIESVTMDMANDIKYRTLIGSSNAMMVDRKPKGALKIQAVDTTVTSVFDAVRNNTLSTISILHGTTAGNKFKIESATNGVGVDTPKYSSSDGIDMLDVNLSFLPTGAGNDEIKITVS